MSRRSRRVQTLPPQPVISRPPPVTVRLLRWVLGRSRSLRIIFVAVFALAVTFALSPVVDAIYLRYFFNQATRILPSLISTAAGLAMYILGWLLMVGTVEEEPPLRLAILWYCALGLLTITLVTGMLVAGWMTGNASG